MFDNFGDSLQGTYDAAAAINAGVGLGEHRTFQSVTTDAMRGMAPVDTTGAGDTFSGIWNGLGGVLGNALNTVTATELARYQRERLGGSSVNPAAAAAPAAAARRPNWLLIGGAAAAAVVVLVLVVKKA